jgi:hypothetical protein
MLPVLYAYAALWPVPRHDRSAPHVMLLGMAPAAGGAPERRAP